ncbi:hypothetical protein J6590_002907 [Homalodisca vitripennis]|nr:hypothetical protein J6590_002907 [Homalodisca vitripennis]
MRELTGNFVIDHVTGTAGDYNNCVTSNVKLCYCVFFSLQRPGLMWDSTVQGLWGVRFNISRVKSPVWLRVACILCELHLNRP